MNNVSIALIIIQTSLSFDMQYMEEEEEKKKVRKKNRTQKINE